ncbi:MAG TPA: FAD-binding protein, partial [Bradyrhizobium sp.]|uniref:FAD-binding protein n=1 Tax=Bradyrhizobium sp. TaxID=376 RepID=UPI002D808B4B
TRDLATYAITKEVEAGRGTPAGGAYLSFQHVAPEQIRLAFGPVVDRLAANGIDLAHQPIEVAPIAHYHMGGIRVGDTLETKIAGLFACGEAIGGANGANRLSGNAITEAFVFGARAGRYAARKAKRRLSLWSDASAPAVEFLRSAERREAPNVAAGIVSLQSLMAEYVGPFRTEAKLGVAIDRLSEMQRDLGDRPLISSPGGFDPVLVDWLDLRNMLHVASAVALPAQARKESRGAHQREDHPGLDEAWQLNQVVSMIKGEIRLKAATDTVAA